MSHSRRTPIALAGPDQFVPSISPHATCLAWNRVGLNTWMIERIEQVKPAAPGTGEPLLPEEWQIVNPEQRWLFRCLFGQLARVLRLEVSPHETLWLARKEEVLFAEKYPAALAFVPPHEIRVLLEPTVGTFEVPAPLPPPQLGNAALVLGTTETWASLGEEHLGPEAQTLRKELEEALHLLAGNPGGRLSPYLEMVQIPCGFDLRWDELDSHLLALRKTQRQGGWWSTPLFFRKDRASSRMIEVERRTLLEVKDHLDTLSHTTDPSLWVRVRQLAQQVAKTYHECAQKRHAGTLMSSSQRRAIRPRSSERAHHVIQVPSFHVARAVIAGLESSTGFEVDKAQRIFRRQQQLPGSTARMEITISPPNATPASWRMVLQAVEQLNHAHVDLWFATLHLAHCILGADRITEPFSFEPKDFLRILGREESRGGYRPQQEAAVLKQLWLLSRMHIQLEFPQAGGGAHTLQSALLHLNSEELEEGLIPGKHHILQLGNWAREAQGLPGQSTHMLLPALHYQQRKTALKRLGWFFSLWFGAERGTILCTMRWLLALTQLLEERNLRDQDLGENPARLLGDLLGKTSRYKGAIPSIGAFDQLVQDQILGGHGCIGEHQLKAGWEDIEVLDVLRTTEGVVPVRRAVMMTKDLVKEWKQDWVDINDKERYWPRKFLNSIWKFDPPKHPSSSSEHLSRLQGQQEVLKTSEC